MQISVIGTGYVGLVTAVLMAELGHRVYGVDIDEKKLAKLKKGRSPIYEPGLEKLLVKNLDRNRLSFSSSYEKAIPSSDVIFVCVGTPPLPDGSYDPKFVFSALESVAKNLKKYAVVVIKSTVPPSIGPSLKKIMDKNTSVSYDLASVPEFLREGSAVRDAFHPDRIVIGASSDKAKTILLKVHEKLPGERIIGDMLSAQLVKYAANAFLATKISFINSLGILADKIGADIDTVVDGFGSDHRIGKSFLQAGLGYGGSCFPKDTHALISYSDSLGYDFSFLKQVDRINDKQIDYFVVKIKNMLGSLKNKTIAILGLAFKAETDDMREARSILLINKLYKLGAKLRVFDPVAMANAKAILKSKQLYFAKNEYDCAKQADVLCLVTEWPQFKKLDFGKIKKHMKKAIIVDGRNFLPKEKLKKMGFSYEGIGRR